MLKIAITGNIASGKSEVEKLISNYYPVYDTDTIAHRILDEITEFYGYDVFTNKKIDRKKLGALVFSNPDAKLKIEEIVHPKVKAEILKIFSTNNNVVFISVPLLFEVGYENLFDKIILVTADTPLRLKRLMARNNLTKEDALRRINAQMPQEDKISKADYIIVNNSNIDNLKTQVNQILQHIS